MMVAGEIRREPVAEFRGDLLKVRSGLEIPEVQWRRENEIIRVVQMKPGHVGEWTDSAGKLPAHKSVAELGTQRDQGASLPGIGILAEQIIGHQRTKTVARDDIGFEFLEFI